MQTFEFPIEICFLWSNWWYTSIDSDNEKPKRRRAIIWTYDGLVYWRIDTPFNLNTISLLTHIRPSTSIQLNTIGRIFKTNKGVQNIFKFAEYLNSVAETVLNELYKCEVIYHCTLFSIWAAGTAQKEPPLYLGMFVATFTSSMNLFYQHITMTP